MELKEQQMNTMREMAQVNLEISSGKALLLKMQEEMDSFAEKRKLLEEKVIEGVHEDAKELIAEIGKSHSKIKAYCAEMRSFTGFLAEFQAALSSVMSDFKKESDSYAQYFKVEQKKISDLRKDLRDEMKAIESEKSVLKNGQIQLDKDRKHIESQRSALKSAFAELKRLSDQNNG